MIDTFNTHYSTVVFRKMFYTIAFKKIYDYKQQHLAKFNSSIYTVQCTGLRISAVYFKMIK